MQKPPEVGYLEGLQHADYVFIGDPKGVGLLALAALIGTIVPLLIWRPWEPR